MDVYVARHGQTDWNANSKICGRTDLPLNALGEKLSASKPCVAPTALRCDFPCAQLLGEDGRDADLFPSVELVCGWLMGASNLGEKDGILRFDTEDGEASLTVHGHKTVILPWKLDLFDEIVRAAVANAGGRPVTVKMRMGIDDDHLTFRDAARIAATSSLSQWPA